MRPYTFTKIQMLRGIAWVVFLTIVSPFGLLFFPASSSALPIRDEAPFPVKVVPFKKLRDPFIKPSLLNNGEAGERDLSLNRLEGGKFVVPFKNGLKTIYTLRPSLQAGMKEYFKKNKVPYGVFVAMNPHTGKVLALVEHSSREPRAKNLALRATYPAASIFKLITASAAIEEKQADPNTEIINRHRSRSSRTTLGDAFAASDNRAFSEVALRYLNTKTLMNYANRFKFNQKIPFELPVQVSRIKTEDSREGLANLAAGFGNVGLSPIHAAMIGSAIANDGIMVNPCLIDRVVGTSGKTILECTPKVFARAISPHTALQLRQMMGLTITQGTGHRAFKSAWKEPALRDIEIGGKTGSLTGENPAGKVTWFVGMAPLDDPEVVISALIINRGNNWKVKASNVAKKGFETYFGEKRKVRFASKQG